MHIWKEDGSEWGPLGEIFHCLKCAAAYYRLSDDCLCANCRVRMEKRRKLWREKQAKGTS